MKKIFVAIVAVAAISFTACNNASKQDIEAANADSIEAPAVEDEVAAEAATEDVADVDATISALTSAVEASDAEQTQSLLAKAQAYIAKLQADGKLEEAKAYIAKIQAFIAANEDKIAAYTGNNAVEAGKEKAGKAIDDAAKSVKGKLGL